MGVNMKKGWKKLIALGLMLTLAVSLLSGCGSKSTESAQEFTMWIYNDDGQGVYYSDYAENPVIQWLNAQYWDTENKTLGSKGNGTQITLKFRVPLQGSEAENFNTMIATED